MVPILCASVLISGRRMARTQSSAQASSIGEPELLYE